MTDFFDNNALFHALTKNGTFWLRVPYIDKDTRQITYPADFAFESEQMRSPWLERSSDAFKKFSSFEYEYFVWMMLMTVWGDRFGRDNGLIECSGNASEGTTRDTIVAEGNA